MPLLRLTQDLVFKIFFSKKEHEKFLISFLTAILKPEKPILSVKVLNPQIPQDAIHDKTIILDLLIEFQDHSQTNVEMQAQNLYNTRKRSLFYWARLHQAQLGEGEKYTAIRPTKMILILDFEELKNEDSCHHIIKTFYYSAFTQEESTNKKLYSDDLEIHVLELPLLKKFLQKNENMKDNLEMLWSQFLNAKSEEEIKEVVKMNPEIFEDASQALQIISNNQEITQMVQAREMAFMNLMSSLEGAEEKGRMEERKEGEAKLVRSLCEGEARLIHSLCEVKNIPIPYSEEKFMELLKPIDLNKLKEFTFKVKKENISWEKLHALILLELKK